MNYLGIDVHSAASVWCLLDQSGEQVERGRTPTTYPALRELASRLGDDAELLAGHEVGSQVYLVHDAISAAGVTIQAFNANHLRMIAASRKKTDKHDAYWIARALQTGMTPHPVYIPNGRVRELRRLLARRRMVMRDRKRPARIAHITKEGSGELRAIMTQAAHIASFPRTKNADELRAYLERIRGNRGRKKIALTALARYMLSIAYHIWRDGTECEPKRMRCNTH